MSLVQKVRIYYSTAFLIGTSIIYSVLYCMFSGDNPENKLNIGIAVFAVLYHVLIMIVKKYFNNKYLFVAIPFIAVFLIQCIYLSAIASLINSMFILVVNLVFLLRYGDEADYYMYKDDLKILSAAVLFSIVMFAVLHRNNSAIDIYRTIVVYLAAVIIALKETMRYSYGIRDTKRADIINISALIIIVIMCSSFASNVVLICGKAVVDGISYAVGKIVILLGYLLGPAFEFLYKIISSKSLNEDIKIETKTTEYKSEQKLNTDSGGGALIAIILKYALTALIAAIIVFIIYKLIKAITLRDLDEDISEDYDEDIESIIETGKKQDVNLTNRIIPDSNSGKVIYLYNKMIRSYKKRNVFKQYMTPGQFGSILKIENDNPDEIDEMNNIYNKARFSQHKITTKELEDANNNIKNILKKKGKK